MAAFASIAGLLLVLHAVSGFTFGPPLCYKNSEQNTLTTSWTFTKNSTDLFNIVRGLIVNSTSGKLQSIPVCSFTVENRTVNSQTITYYNITSTVNLSNASDTTNGCGITKLSVNGQETYRMIIGLRRHPNFTTGVDGTYQWFCKPSEATNTFVNAKVEVLTPNLITPIDSATLNLTFEVAKQDSQNNWVPTTTCNLGDDLQLHVRYGRPLPHEDFLTPWGIFIYNTKAGPEASNIFQDIFVSTGCAASNPLGFNGPFARDSSSSQSQSLYVASGGKCRRYGNTNELYFQTFVGFCSGVYEADQRCINFCNSQSGRKKRSEDDDEDYETPRQLTVTVNILGESPEEDKTIKSLLVGLIVGLIVLIAVIIAIAAVVMLCARKRRYRGSKSRFSNPSVTSSTSSIPAKY